MQKSAESREPIQDTTEVIELEKLLNDVESGEALRKITHAALNECYEYLNEISNKADEKHLLFGAGEKHVPEAMKTRAEVALAKIRKIKEAIEAIK